ncbi:MAG: hypothetical protein HFI47_01790 [Lachnospiraceae bacterium]|nr:hypothetical protein [Lachnospiraceae bacterium]
MKKKDKGMLAVLLAVAVILAPTVGARATEGSYTGSRPSYDDTSGSAGGGTIFDRVTGGGSSYEDTSGAVGVNPVATPEEEIPTPEPIPTREPDFVSETPEPTGTPASTPEATRTPKASPTGTKAAEKTPGADSGEASPESDLDETEVAEEISEEELESTEREADREGTSGIGEIPEEAFPTPSANPHRNKVKGKESTVKGVYLATAVDGCAVITDAQVIRDGYGLAAGEEIHAKFSNLNGAEYPVSQKLLNMTADSQGAEVAASLSIEFGKMEGTKYSVLPSDGSEIQIMVGLPEQSAGSGWTYAVAAVRRNGSIYILEDMDQDPDTVTFTTTAGAGAYALIRY